jgi:hypothetical protein
MPSLVKEFNKFWKDVPLVGWAVVLLIVITMIVALVLIGLWVYRSFPKTRGKENVGASRTITVRMSPSPAPGDRLGMADSVV